MQEEKALNKISVIRINTKRAWQDFELLSDNLMFTDNGISLKKTYTYVFGREITGNLPLDIRDIAVDECDNIYIISGKERYIYKYDRFIGTIEKLGCRDGQLPVKLNSPAGIGIDKDTIYVADTVTEESGRYARIIALSRINLQMKWILEKKEDGSCIKPIIDMTTGPDGNIYLLEEELNNVLILNRGGEIIEALTNPEIEHPTDLAVSNAGTVYILDNSKIHFFTKTDNYIYQKREIKNLDKDFSPSGLSVNSQEEIFIGEAGPSTELKTIHTVAEDGSLSPLWSYRGATRRIINDSTGNIYIINDEGNRLCFLEHKKVVARNSQDQFIGYFISKPINSYAIETAWHRFLIDGKFRKGTQIKFLYYTSDNLLDDESIKNLSDEDWNNGLQGDASLQGEKKREGLFLKNSKGQYLWFKIYLLGNEEDSPETKSVNLYFPRTAYIEYLPALYREDPISKDFLERFLSIFESLLYETDFSIENISRYFDALGSPPEFLDWLGSWLSATFDQNWTDDQKRRFILKAVDLYRKRGTRAGMEEVIELFLQQKPYIIENFQRKYSKVRQQDIISADNSTFDSEKDILFFPPEEATVKKKDGQEVPLADVLYGKEPFCFCVLLKERIDDSTYRAVKNIINDFKPAHTCYGLKMLEPWFYLDMHTYLGVNTVLNRSSFILEESSIIGRDTLLQDIEEAGQVSKKSRIGIDDKLT